jgi:hypothetical protein
MRKKHWNGERRKRIANRERKEGGGRTKGDGHKEEAL